MPGPLSAPRWMPGTVLSAPRWAPSAGWDMPISYAGAGVVAEHTAVRTAAGVFDVSHLGKATVTGPGAAAFVNDCLTADLGRIQPGQAQYTLCCNGDGGVHRRSDRLSGLRRTRSSSSRTRRTPPRWSPRWPRPLPRASRSSTGTPISRCWRCRARRPPRCWPRSGCPPSWTTCPGGDGTLDGAPVRVCRTGYTGEHGYELVPAWDAARAGLGRAACTRPACAAAGRRAWAPGTPCAPRWATRCTGRTWARRSARCRPGWAGRSAGASPASSAGTRC